MYNRNVTRELKGRKRVRVLGKGVSTEKSQVTAMLCVTESGSVLPPQIIFQGKTHVLGLTILKVFEPSLKVIFLKRYVLRVCTLCARHPTKLIDFCYVYPFFRPLCPFFIFFR